MKRIAMMVMLLAAGLSLATGVFAQGTGGNSHGKQNACAHSHGHAHGCSGSTKVKGTPDATEAAEATDTPDNDNGSNGKGHPNNHGSAVSAVAKGTCTAPNPHHPATSNHGMCVSAAAHGNNGKTKQGKKSKTAKSKSKH